MFLLVYLFYSNMFHSLSPLPTVTTMYPTSPLIVYNTVSEPEYHGPTGLYTPKLPHFVLCDFNIYQSNISYLFHLLHTSLFIICFCCLILVGFDKYRFGNKSKNILMMIQAGLSDFSQMLIIIRSNPQI